MTTINYDIILRGIGGEDAALEQHRGKVLLIVNTASECGFTTQLDGLEQLWKEYGPQGLVILGFPCNQFGGQEPGADDEIASFCRLNYGVTFPMHSKIDVNGSNAHPLFVQLKDGAPGLLNSKPIKWNFTKFLVAADGEVLQRFAPTVEPSELGPAIESALNGGVERRKSRP